MVRARIEGIIEYQHAMAAWVTYYRVAQRDLELDYRRAYGHRNLVRTLKSEGERGLRVLKKAYRYGRVMDAQEFDVLLWAVRDDLASFIN